MAKLLVYNGKLVTNSGRLVSYSGSTPPVPRLTTPGILSCPGFINLLYTVETEDVAKVDKAVVNIKYQDNTMPHSTYEFYLSYPYASINCPIFPIHLLLSTYCQNTFFNRSEDMHQWLVSEGQVIGEAISPVLTLDSDVGVVSATLDQARQSVYDASSLQQFLDDIGGYNFNFNNLEIRIKLLPIENSAYEESNWSEFYNLSSELTHSIWSAYGTQLESNGLTIVHFMYHDMMGCSSSDYGYNPDRPGYAEVPAQTGYITKTGGDVASCYCSYDSVFFIQTPDIGDFIDRGLEADPYIASFGLFAPFAVVDIALSPAAQYRESELAPAFIYVGRTVPTMDLYQMSIPYDEEDATEIDSITRLNDYMTFEGSAGVLDRETTLLRIGFRRDNL